MYLIILLNIINAHYIIWYLAITYGFRKGCINLLRCCISRSCIHLWVNCIIRIDGIFYEIMFAVTLRLDETCVDALLVWLALYESLFNFVGVDSILSTYTLISTITVNLSTLTPPRATEYFCGLHSLHELTPFFFFCCLYWHYIFPIGMFSSLYYI